MVEVHVHDLYTMFKLIDLPSSTEFHGIHELILVSRAPISIKGPYVTRKREIVKINKGLSNAIHKRR